MLNCTQSREQLALWAVLDELERTVLKQRLCQCADCQAALVQAITFAQQLEVQREHYQTRCYEQPMPTTLAQAVQPKQTGLSGGWLSLMSSAALATCFVVMVMFGNLLSSETTPKPMHLLNGPTIAWMDKPKTRLFKQQTNVHLFKSGNWQSARRSVARPTTYSVYRRLSEHHFKI